MEENNQAGGSSYKMNSESKCPRKCSNHKNRSGSAAKSNKDWWPNQLQLNILRQHADFSNPWENFDYAAEKKKRHIRFDDKFSRLVASRLWSLWTILY
jgi:catalase-peroxidase